jgi:16S rRNA (adenine1518-N6/adenine1519-N6)-dimethyltransferase
MQHKVRAKKHLGQHFLKNEEVAKSIAGALTVSGYKNVLEIGPGTGVLTKYLIENKNIKLKGIELDEESVSYLSTYYPMLTVIHGDFLQLQFSKIFPEPFAIIGNFPYNISSQIMFKVLDNMDQIPEIVGMFQKEVAMRIASGPGNKDYGILSVLLQAHYDVEYLFTVEPGDFIPPPKVKSGVIRVIRKADYSLPCDAKIFKTVVKAAFNQRRKTLRNSVKNIFASYNIPTTGSIFDKRPEQLSVNDFIGLTQLIQKHEI